MILSDLSEIFNDTKRRAASLRQHWTWCFVGLLSWLSLFSFYRSTYVITGLIAGHYWKQTGTFWSIHTTSYPSTSYRTSSTPYVTSDNCNIDQPSPWWALIRDARAFFIFFYNKHLNYFYCTDKISTKMTNFKTSNSDHKIKLIYWIKTPIFVLFR